MAKTEKKFTVMDILKRLPKTNCKDCGFPACMAFAVQLEQGEVSATKCPHLSDEAKEILGGITSSQRAGLEAERDKFIEEYRKQMKNVDLEEAAKRLEAPLTKEGIVVHALGKIFVLDQEGRIHSDCHQNAWVHLPILRYVVRCPGVELLHDWVVFAELKEAKSWARYFEHKCENPLKEIADKDPDFFFDMLELFAAPPDIEKIQAHDVEADLSITLYPLPKLPMHIAYRRADDKFDSTLTLFFDKSAQANSDPESLYMLVVGLIEMLKRIMLRFGAA